MKFAFSTLGCPDWPIEKVVEFAKNLGYDGVEIRGIRRQLDLTKAPEFAADRIGSTIKLFEFAGVKIVSVDTSASFCWPEKARQESSFAEAESHVYLAEKLGVKLVRVFGGYVPEGEAVERWARTLADYLRRLADISGKRGVTVALETHDSWKRASDIMPVIKMADHEYVKVLWDVAHPWTEGETIEESAQQLKGHVIHVHVKDHSADHQERLLGKGIIPLAEAFTALRSMKYSGYISLEWEKMWKPEIEEPEVCFPQAIEYMRHLDSIS